MRYTVQKLSNRYGICYSQGGLTRAHAVEIIISTESEGINCKLLRDDLHCEYTTPGAKP